ncbi:NmrA domain-containing protein [Mycena sanguinolenta]|uniref:NmrA domain-containing protein n=1 Tax=Mycena sanguinolenta TaxID=230812 RepID=A0A8H7CL98_9AGAR|nr:NmrA domain-containing protein [Mycena sanguinolenta]
MTITQSASAPLVAVVGATGVQGGSVIKALSESDKAYRIRGFTRDPTKAAAEILKKRGVQIVAINLVLENKEEIFKAFAGADYAFLCTNFWEHGDGEKELSEGKMLVDAAKAAGVKGAIWSGLPAVKKISAGKYSRVAHFDRKALVAEYGRASGIPFVEVQAGFYATNLLGNFPLLAKEPDGTYALAWPVRPSTVMPVIDMEHDFGLYIRRVLEVPVFPDGSVVCTTGEDITVPEMARQLSQVTGKQVVFKQVSAEEAENNFVAFGYPSAAAGDIVQGMLFFDEFGYYGGQATASREGLARPTRTFTEFAKDADWSKTLV